MMNFCKMQPLPAHCPKTPGDPLPAVISLGCLCWFWKGRVAQAEWSKAESKALLQVLLPDTTVPALARLEVTVSFTCACDVPELGNASSVPMDGATSKGGKWPLHHNGQKNTVLQREKNCEMQGEKWKQPTICVLVCTWFLFYIQILLLYFDLNWFSQAANINGLDTSSLNPTYIYLA